MTQFGLMVRKTARHEIVLPVRMRVSAVHAGIVRMSGSNAGPLEAEAQLLDVSSSGAGVVSHIFIPRMTRIDLQLPMPGSWALEDVDQDDAAAMVPSRVLRVVMTDRRPAYLFGLAFELEGASRPALERLDGLLALLERSADGPDGPDDAGAAHDA